EDTMLPMMYMPDCLKATMDLFLADKENLKHHSNFNVAAMSFTAAEQVESIRKHIPELEVEYVPDFRQQIADSWPKSIDDSAAREEWGWKEEFDLEAMTADMLKEIRIKVEKGLY
ncbi:MAG: L-threonine 3-dehydrogenase, partial [Bacteroidales bacterium]|nr:L-threonine 3-dehydrogenase [Bacteroidales bacterium]